jgi:outer membrane protein assembly factor BamB
MGWRGWKGGTGFRAIAIVFAAILAPASPAHPAPPAPDTTLPLFPLRTVWTLSLNNALTNPPGFSGSRGYFPIEGDRLVAYDLMRGEQLWLISAATTSQPIAGDGLVFITQAGTMTALNDRDGSEAWKLPFDEKLASSLVWDNGWLIAATIAGDLIAFRAIDGHLLWRQQAGTRASAPPALAADRVYVPLEDRRILALQVETGRLLWNRRIGGAPNEILARDDRIYVGASDNFLYCLKADTGRIDWRWRTGADVIGRPVADERRLYFVSLDNMLRALDRTGGTQQWKRGLPMRPRTGPQLTADTLIVGGLATALRGYSARNGTPAGEIALASDPAAPVHVVPGDLAPLIIAVTVDVAKGATVVAFTREVEPKALPVTPLPNPTTPPAAPASLPP